jgi:multiple sugar transport system substrate-binding protein
MPSRRAFLRLMAMAGAGGVLSAAGCSRSTSGRPVAGSASKGARTLRIAQTIHYVPAYDTWFDTEYVRQWGEQNDVTVVVDHYPLADMFGRTQAEVAAGRGHDLFGLFGAPAVFEDDVIDHRDVVEEVEAKLGGLTPAVRRDIRNRRTGKYFALTDFWTPSMVLYRTDLWSGLGPGVDVDTWAGVIEGGARLNGAGAPVGIGFGSGPDPAINGFGLLLAHGGSLQDEEGRLALDGRAAVEAVEAAKTLHRLAMTDDVLTWDDAADNRFLASGKASLTLDPVSAVRAIEEQDPALAANIGLRPAPAGPGGRLFPHAAQHYFICNFSPNQDLAKQFLVDLAIGYREAFLRSLFYNLPAFPASVPDLPEIVVAEASGRYRLLAEATTWSTNIGHPGDTNPAVAEVFHQGLLPKMFLAALRGELGAEEAVRRTAAQAGAIFDKWRERGKI